MIFYASYSKKAQLKIQQMAFVLIAILIFFAIIAIFYFSFYANNIKKNAESLSEQEASEIVRKLSSTPEFSFLGCTNCIDFDKIIVLKARNSYKELFNLDFLQIEKIYPISEKLECDKFNYPECNTITLIQNEKIGSPKIALVSICRWENKKGGYYKCEIGRIYASGKDLG